MLPCDAVSNNKNMFVFVFGQIKQASGLLAGSLARCWLVGRYSINGFLIMILFLGSMLEMDE